jgi:hypothetical protein
MEDGGGGAMFFGLIIAAIIGILIGKDASARGMSGFGWGFCTFLLCIVTVPIYLIVRKPHLDARR